MADAITQPQLDSLEKYLDSVWKQIGMDVGFSRHFIDRVNDSRNGKQITIDELQRLFVEAYKKYGPAFLKLGKRDRDIEGVLSDRKTDVNSPFALKWDRIKKEFELKAVTVMRKKNFTPNNKEEKKYTVEDYTRENRMFGNPSESMLEDIQNVQKRNHAERIVKEIILEEYGVVSETELPLTERKSFDQDYKETLDSLTEEDVNELSKETLKSYVKKGDRSYDHLNGKAVQAGRNAEMYQGISKRATDHFGAEASRIGKKADRRAKFLNKADAKIAEDNVDEEEVNELSKKTLGSYAKKASYDIAGKASDYSRLAAQALTYNNGGDSQKKVSAASEKAFHKASSRLKYHDKAVDKLTKEETVDEEEVNELSKGKLKAYIKKNEKDDNPKNFFNRVKGHATAEKKLKEEEINEDGETKHVTPHGTVTEWEHYGVRQFRAGGKRFGSKTAAINHLKKLAAPKPKNEETTVEEQDSPSVNDSPGAQTTQGTLDRWKSRAADVAAQTKRNRMAYTKSITMQHRNMHPDGAIALQAHLNRARNIISGIREETEEVNESDVHEETDSLVDRSVNELSKGLLWRYMAKVDKTGQDRSNGVDLAARKRSGSAYYSKVPATKSEANKELANNHELDEVTQVEGEE